MTKDSKVKEKIQVKAKDVEKALKPPLSDKRIYVGPGKPGLITNTVYSGGYPLFVKKMIEDCPAIESLMVKIPDYAKAKDNVKKVGTIEHANAKKVADYFKSEGVKN